MLKKYGFQLPSAETATDRPIKESTKKNSEVSQSGLDDSLPDAGMAAVDLSKIRSKAHQKSACSKSPVASTPNAEDHKTARSH